MKNSKKMRVGNKNLALVLLSVVLMFSVFASVSAIASVNVTILVPHISNSGFLNGVSGNTAVINVSLSNAPEQNYTRAQAYIVSAGATSNTTLAIINNSLGGNINLTSSNSGLTYNISLTIPTNTLMDGNDYNLTVNLWNGSNYFNVTRTVTVDNGVPVAPTTLVPANLVTNSSTGNYNFSGRVVQANTTACTLFLSGAGNTNFVSYHDSYSVGTGISNTQTTSCSVTTSFNSSSVNGQYLWYLQASDGTNVTNTAVQTIYISIPGSSGTVLNQDQVNQLAHQQAQATGQNTLSVGSNASSGGIPAPVFLTIGFILVYLLIAWLVEIFPF